MKVTISLPDELFEAADTLAKRLGVSRSRLYATAVADFITTNRDRKVTAQVNRAYSTEQSGIEPMTRRLQARSVGSGSW